MPKMPRRPQKAPKLTTSNGNSHLAPSWCIPASLVARSQLLYSQLTVSEISGSVGDLGTFIPLAVALARQNAIALSPALFWAGFANVVTGFLWDVPCAVQPMKAISAVAISHELSKLQVTTAGIGMGILMVFLSVTKGIEVVNWLVPTPVCSGIQMGVGINLAVRGLQMIQELSWWDQLDCITLALIVGMLCLYALREPDILATTTTTTTTSATSTLQNYDESAASPTSNVSSKNQPTSTPPFAVGLYLFGLGVLLALVHMFQHRDDAVVNQTTDTSQSSWFSAVVVWALKDATFEDWKQGLLQGALPQLPLTTLNSVVSVCALAHSLYPEKRKRTVASTPSSSASTLMADAVISRREVSWSVGLMNLILCPLGAMPCCHGVGGLAGQHKFGARHGASVVFLGLAKMITALLLGRSILRVLESLPSSILGLMLVVCGHELAVMGWTILQKPSGRAPANEHNHNSMRKGAVVALLTVVVDVGLHKTHYAALAGWVAYMIYGDGIKDYSQQVSYRW